MNADLPQKFEDYARGATRIGVLERDLLTLCRETPASTWDVLALLDQFYRRGKMSGERCRSLRQKIERQALGLESYESLSTLEPDAIRVEPPGREWPTAYTRPVPAPAPRVRPVPVPAPDCSPASGRSMAASTP